MLLDTSGLFSVFHRREKFHQRAIAEYDRAKLRLTHNYVLSELVALANVRGCDRSDLLKFIAALQRSPKVSLTWVDQTLHQEGLNLLSQRLDKTYSLCDAVSFVLMRRFNVQDALSTDRHFEQEGFRRLLV